MSSSGEARLPKPDDDDDGGEDLQAVLALPVPQRRWVVLISLATMVADNDAQILPGTDVRFDFQDPPHPSTMLLRRGVAPEPDYDHALNYVIGTHPSGRLLLAVLRNTAPPVRCAYFICDAHARSAARLPRHADLFPSRNIALIADDAAGGYMVAQLQRGAGNAASYADLLCYSTRTNEWVTRHLADGYPDLRHRSTNWSTHGAFAHGGALWFVDIAQGMLCCDDPFADNPHLRLVPLPVGSEIDAQALRLQGEPMDRRMLDGRRFIRLSEGSLRYVEITGGQNPTAPANTLPETATVCMWTLVRPAGPEHHWEYEYAVPFTAIWNNETYHAAGLPPKTVPALALVDPGNHRMLYFFHGCKLFSVDTRTNRVESCEDCVVQRHPDHYIPHNPDYSLQNSRFVEAWELPPTLICLLPLPGAGSAAGMEGGSDDDHEEEAAPASTEVVDDEKFAEQLSQIELRAPASTGVVDDEKLAEQLSQIELRAPAGVEMPSEELLKENTAAASASSSAGPSSSDSSA